MKLVVVIATIGLAVTASASAELVAKVPDGLVAVTPRGAPLVGFVRGSQLVIARRTAPGRWRQQPVAQVGRGATLAAFDAGAAGPVAVVLARGDRTLSVIRQVGKRWLKTTLTGRLEPDITLGWPGLALDRRGKPVVAYTRWHSRSLYSQLILARLDGRKPHTQRVTAGGWPKSYTPPPSAPVVLPNGRIHVVETYGVSGVVGTIEWIPRNKTWIGQFLSGGRGGFPIGPMFAARGRGSVVWASWSEAFPGSIYGGFPVTLARHGREITEDIVSERGVSAGLAMTPHGPQVAANEWVSGNDVSFAFPAADTVWAGTVSGPNGSELDGRITGYAEAPNGAQDLLLSRPDGLSWFRTRSLPVHVILASEKRDDGSMLLTGHVQGSHGGKVTIYREHTKTRRDVATTLKLGSSGEFSLVEPARTDTTFYRAVYTDPKSGIPYAKLLRDPVDAPFPGQ